MSEYLYVFGYESPVERAANLRSGSDFESTGLFRIVADQKQDAERWGAFLANWYVNQLFGGDEEWKSGGYAAWVEDFPDEGIRDLASRVAPIRVGEFPDLSNMREALAD